MSEKIDTNALKTAAEMALQYAKQQGATAAEVGINQSQGLSVNVRQGDVETLEYNNDKGLAITVYFGHRQGSASTADLQAQAIADVVTAATDIAKYTEEDHCAGLAAAELMATEQPDLDLYHPWDITAEQAIELALTCEQAGFAVDSKISNSEGASVSSHQNYTIYANSHGFIGNKMSTRHSLACTLISDDDSGMQRDYWYDMARDASDLKAAHEIGQRAGQRTLQRRNPRKVVTGHYPVIFAVDVAPSLFAKFISAIKGGALYRRSSFLLDHLAKKIFPDFIHIHEQPHLLKGLGSAAYDGDGLATQTSDIVQAGVLQRYVLDTYSAKKLKMTSTANAGGVRNLTIEGGSLDLQAMIRQMDKGVIVTETMGMGVNIVTGDYSQGAAGFWVENGEIQYPIDEFTIASNLVDMYRGIQAIGNDIELRGNIRTGSVWLDKMTVAS